VHYQGSGRLARFIRFELEEVLGPGVLRRGQSDLVTVILLVGTVLVIGAAFSSLAVAHVVDFTSRGRVRQLLLAEQASLVVYREFEDGVRLCLGILRVDPSNTRYAVALLSTDMGVDLLELFPNALTIPGAAPRLRRVPRVYHIHSGEYYPVPVKGYVRVAEVPEEVVERYVMQRRPFLVCVSKDAVVGGARLLVLVYIGSDLYEVGGWYVYA